MAERIPDVSRRVPVRADVASQEQPDGRVVLRRRRFGPVRRAVLRLVGQPADLTVHLDPLGSAAWRLMDGRATVAQVLAALQARFPDERDLAPRLGRYLSALVGQGFVRLE